MCMWVNTNDQKHIQYIHKCMHDNTYMHTYTRAYIHACIHTYVHIHKHMLSSVFFTCTLHTYTHTHTHTQIHACGLLVNRDSKKAEGKRKYIKTLAIGVLSALDACGFI
jgi:hypothetical protein